MKNKYIFFVAFCMCATLSFAQYNNGFIIPNEGNFGSSNAEISYLGNTTITNNLYNTVNSEALGDVFQQAYLYRDNAYLVVNNSNKIVVVDRMSLQKQTEFTVNQPRYIAIANKKSYITRTDYSASPYTCSVEIFNVSDNTLVTSIALPAGSIAEQIVSRGNTVYVMEKTASGDDKLHIIDATTDAITSTLTIQDDFKSMLLYKEHLYVLASDASYNGPGTYTTLYKIQLSDNTIATQVSTTSFIGAKKLAIDNDIIYFTGGTGVYTADINTLVVNTTPLFNVTDNSFSTFYGFNVIDGNIYSCDAKGFTAASEITVYDTSGTVLNTYNATKGVNSVVENVYKIYAPKAGDAGSTAIAATDTSIKSWATGCALTRGYKDIADQSQGLTDVGDETSAIGVADGSGVVSLGDGGVAVLTFDKAIANGEGADFVVFENSFSDDFLELAFVEVSSDGTNFFRFPAVTLVNPYQPLGGTYGDSFGTIDPRNLHNFASKYKANFGTPFNLDDIEDNPNLDKNNITHVKLIDVIGTTDPQYATYDSNGIIVKDPYPTAFGSGGFDLDAVGVINESGVLSFDEVSKAELFSFYPNPAKERITIYSKGMLSVNIYNVQGKLVKQTRGGKVQEINISNLSKGIYIIEAVNSVNAVSRKKLVIK